MKAYVSKLFKRLMNKNPYEFMAVLQNMHLPLKDRPTIELDGKIYILMKTRDY